jgi:hypothetical protein
VNQFGSYIAEALSSNLLDACWLARELKHIESSRAELAHRPDEPAGVASAPPEVGS